jgi:plastocyanin
MPSARQRNVARSVAAAGLVLVALAGCGGSESTTRAGDGRVRIVLDDFSIAPQRVRVPAGETSFQIVNRGRIGHNFHVVGRNGEPVEVTTLFPGERKSAAATVRRGNYRMVCTVSNHEELGMYGTLVVR